MPKDTTSHSDTSGSQTTTIPRPPNPWILFRRDVCAQPAFKALYPKAPQHIVSRAISVMWRDASPEVRARYESLAVLAAIEHEKRYPGYKYRPRKNGEKNKLASNHHTRDYKGQHDSSCSAPESDEGPMKILPIPLVQTSGLLDPIQHYQPQSNTSPESFGHGTAWDLFSILRNVTPTPNSGDPNFESTPFPKSAFKSKEWSDIQEVATDFDLMHAPDEFWLWLASDPEFNRDLINIHPFDNTIIDHPEDFNFDVSGGILDASLSLESDQAPATATFSSHSHTFTNSLVGSSSSSAFNASQQKGDSSYGIHSLNPMHTGTQPILQDANFQTNYAQPVLCPQVFSSSWDSQTNYTLPHPPPFPLPHPIQTQLSSNAGYTNSMGPHTLQTAY